MKQEYELLEDQMLPQNVIVEEAILGTILIDPEAIDYISNQLTPEAFYVYIHREIYKAALTLRENNQSVDLVTVTAYLRDHGKLEELGGMDLLTHLAEKAVNIFNFDQYIALIIDKYLRRGLIETGQKIIRLGYEFSSPLETILEEAEQTLFKITRSQSSQEVIPASEVLSEVLEELKNRSQGISSGAISSGFQEIDSVRNVLYCNS